MTTALDRLLGLRRGERTRALLLFSYLFLVISTSVAGKATRDALFLQQHDAARLPYADAAVALGVVAVVALYVRGRRAMNLLTLQVGSLLLFAAGALALWRLGQGGAPPAWHPAVVYLWVGVFGVLGPVQVWTLANYVLTLREGKRLFGLVGGGAILGWVVGGLMTTATAGRYGADNVLLALAVALAACAVLVFAIWQRRPAAFGDEEVEVHGRGSTPTSLCESFAMVARSPYLRALAVVIAFSSLVTGIAAWQFKAIAKVHIPATDELAAFFGCFNVWAGLLALAIQCLLTSRVLRRFGVGVALFIVPVSLALGSAGLLAFGTLAAAVVLKGSDHVLRYSIDKSTVETLFLPVPAEQTFHAKLVIDGIVWRAGDVAGSAILLLAVAGLGVSAVGMGWINLVLLAAWMATAWVAYRRYLRHLSETIQHHRLDTARTTAPVLDRAMNDMVSSKLRSGRTEDVLYGMALLDVSVRRATHPAVRPLLAHPAPEVRARAIAILADAGDTTVAGEVERLLGNPDARVRTQALLFVSQHAHVDPLTRIAEVADFDDVSMRCALIAFLARPGAGQNLEAARLILAGMVGETGAAGQRTRQEAARLLGSLPNHFERELRVLLDDEDDEVARQAIRSVGRLCKRPYVEHVVARLATPSLAAEAADALAACGDRVVGALRDRLVDGEERIDLRRQIPAVLRRIGSPAAKDALLENMAAGDTILRSRIIEALDDWRQARPDEPFDDEVVETVLLAEVLGHYRWYRDPRDPGPGPGRGRPRDARSPRLDGPRAGPHLPAPPAPLPVPRRLRGLPRHPLLEPRHPRQGPGTARPRARVAVPLAADAAGGSRDHAGGTDRARGPRGGPRVREPRGGGDGPHLQRGPEPEGLRHLFDRRSPPAFPARRAGPLPRRSRSAAPRDRAPLARAGGLTPGKPPLRPAPEQADNSRGACRRLTGRAARTELPRRVAEPALHWWRDRFTRGCGVAALHIWL